MTLCTSYLSKPWNVFWYSRNGGHRNELGRVVGDVLDLHQDGGSGSVDPAKVGAIRGKDLELVKRFLFVVRIADQLDHSFTIVSSGINLINIWFKVLCIQHFFSKYAVQQHVICGYHAFVSTKNTFCKKQRSLTLFHALRYLVKICL